MVLNGTDNFDEAFWNSDRTWNNIFTALDGTTALDIASVFKSGVEYYNSAGSVLNGNTTGRSFTISGTSLSWTAVPEPTSALAGLLLGAGLLRRREEMLDVECWILNGRAEPLRGGSFDSFIFTRIHNSKFKIQNSNIQKFPHHA